MLWRLFPIAICFVFIFSTTAEAQPDQRILFDKCTSSAGTTGFKYGYAPIIQGRGVWITDDCRVVFSEVSGWGGRAFANWWQFDSWLKGEIAVGRPYPGLWSEVEKLDAYSIAKLGTASAALEKGHYSADLSGRTSQAPIDVWPGAIDTLWVPLPRNDMTLANFVGTRIDQWVSVNDKVGYQTILNELARVNGFPVPMTRELAGRFKISGSSAPAFPGYSVAVLVPVDLLNDRAKTNLQKSLSRVSVRSLKGLTQDPHFKARWKAYWTGVGKRFIDEIDKMPIEDQIMYALMGFGASRAISATGPYGAVVAGVSGVLYLTQVSHQLLQDLIWISNFKADSEVGKIEAFGKQRSRYWAEQFYASALSSAGALSATLGRVFKDIEVSGPRTGTPGLPSGKTPSELPYGTLPPSVPTSTATGSGLPARTAPFPTRALGWSDVSAHARNSIVIAVTVQPKSTDTGIRSGAPSTPLTPDPQPMAAVARVEFLPTQGRSVRSIFTKAIELSQTPAGKVEVRAPERIASEFFEPKVGMGIAS